MIRTVAALLLVSFATAARAQISSTAVPVFHGKLKVTRPAIGTIDRHSGIASVRISGWTFEPVSYSNGVYPAQEPIVVAMGEESLRIEAGSLKPKRGGKVFAYHAKGVTRGIRSLRLSHKADGTYVVAARLAGVDLSQLNFADPICVPMALIVGDDDGFSPVDITSPSFTSRRITIPDACSSNNDWPWIQQ